MLAFQSNIVLLLILTNVGYINTACKDQKDVILQTTTEVLEGCALIVKKLPQTCLNKKFGGRKGSCCKSCKGINAKCLDTVSESSPIFINRTKITSCDEMILFDKSLCNTFGKKKGKCCVSCKNLGPCNPNPCVNGKCLKKKKKFKCLCNPGFIGPLCNKVLSGIPNLNDLGCLNEYLNSVFIQDFQVFAGLSQLFQATILANNNGGVDLDITDTVTFVPDTFDATFTLLRLVFYVKNVQKVIITLYDMNQIILSTSDYTFHVDFFTVLPQEVTPVAQPDYNIIRQDISAQGARNVDTIDVSFVALNDNKPININNIGIEGCFGGDLLRRCKKQYKAFGMTSMGIASTNQADNALKSLFGGSKSKFFLSSNQSLTFTPKSRNKCIVISKRFTFRVLAVEFTVEGATDIMVTFVSSGQKVYKLERKKLLPFTENLVFSITNDQLPPNGINNLNSIVITFSKGAFISNTYIQTCISQGQVKQKCKKSRN